MFNRGITELLTALPEFSGLSQQNLRRLLSTAYAEALDLRADPSGDSRERAIDDLARLGVALETHAVLAPSADRATVRACAFVAAECIALLAELDVEPPRRYASSRLEPRRYRRVEAGLLYLIAGYDANASVMARPLRPRSAAETGSTGRRLAAIAAEHAISEIRSLLALRPQRHVEAPPDNPAAQLPWRVRAELWRQLGAAANAQFAAVRLRPVTRNSREILDGLLSNILDQEAVAYSDIALLARLLRLACEETDARALRTVPGPPDDSGWAAYVAQRASQRPLIWPAAQAYARFCLSGNAWHAAVAVPTGAGKSGVAELAVAHELHRGWVLYLAPTNALVTQIRRDLESALATYPSIAVRGFAGGAEISGAVEEAIGDVEERQVLVMTPEKCSLALRQAPEAFKHLSLCVLDECHLLGERGTRGVLAELVLAHILAFDGHTRVLLLSALMDNPANLAAWLQTATGVSAEPIQEPWRPTRTLRAVLGFDRLRFDPRHSAADAERVQLDKKELAFEAPAALLAGLQGAWDGTDSPDFALVPTDVDVPASSKPEGASYSSNDALAAMSAGLVRQGHRVLAFIPKNRHWAFSVGDKIDLSEVRKPADPETIDQLTLARHELGVPSKVSELIARGVAVHTGALLDSERRACEHAFVSGQVSLLLATGTLAQGLNLPATAVVIGGTEVGYDARLTNAQRRERAKIQLLNAVGRAGRPQTAARSLAIVVPEKPLVIQGPESAQKALRAVPFFRYEDAASPVHSRLDVLIDRALRGEYIGEDMTIEELAAFAVLPLDAPDLEASEVVRRTYGAFERGAASRESAAVIAGSLKALGQRFLGDRPRWLAEAAYLAGLTVQQAIALHDGFLNVEVGDRSDMAEWVDATLLAMMELPIPALRTIVAPETVKGTLAANIFGAPPESEDNVAAWDVLRDTAALWLAGATYSEIACSLVDRRSAGKAERHQRAPIPKVVRVVNEVFGFGLARCVGCLVALHQAGSEANVTEWRLTPDAARALELAPVAIRHGSDEYLSLAWTRFGSMPRRLARAVAGSLDAPLKTSDDALSQWVSQNFASVLDGSQPDTSRLKAEDRAALEAWRRLRTG